MVSISYNIEAKRFKKLENPFWHKDIFKDDEAIMKSKAQTIDEYLNDMPLQRRETLSAVRKIILENLPDGYEEVMNWGMIAYQVPLKVYPDTYNKKPLMYAALANQKNYMAVYLCGLYCIPGMKESFQKAFESAGKKLNMGASCVRFKKLQDLPLDVLASTIAAVDLKTFVANAKSVHRKK